MIRQSWTIIMLIGAGFLVTGCAETLTITYRSDPPGAAIYQNGTRVGYAPLVSNHPLSEEDFKKEYVILNGITMQWPSGATASISNTIVDPTKGLSWTRTITRPNVPGELEDLQYADKLRQAESRGNAQLLLGVLRGFNAGMQNRSASRQPPTNALQGALRGFNDGLQKSSAQSSDRWMDEGGDDRRNMRTGELEMNMGGGGSLNTTTGELRHGAGGGDTIGSDGQYRQDGQEEDGNYTADFLD